MSDSTLLSFRYRLEQQPPHTSSGGLVRGASVRQFPVSQGIAGASMRLQPGSLRELHWHTTAAELGYVVSGSCRTTVLSPDGAATDTFGPGECHFILIFDNGAFAEDHTLSITDWLAHTSAEVVSQNLGLEIEWAAKLPKGKAPGDQAATSGRQCNGRSRTAQRDCRNTTTAGRHAKKLDHRPSCRCLLSHGRARKLAHRSGKVRAPSAFYRSDHATGLQPREWPRHYHQCTAHARCRRRAQRNGKQTGPLRRRLDRHDRGERAAAVTAGAIGLNIAPVASF
jgi:Cupin